MVLATWLFLFWFVYEWRWPEMSIDHFIQRVNVRDIGDVSAVLAYPKHAVIRARIDSFWGEVQPLATNPPVARIILGERGEGPQEMYRLPSDSIASFFFGKKSYAVVDTLMVDAVIPWSGNRQAATLAELKKHPETIEELPVSECEKCALRLFAERKPFLVFAKPVEHWSRSYYDREHSKLWRVYAVIRTKIELCKNE